MRKELGVLKFLEELKYPLGAVNSVIYVVEKKITNINSNVKGNDRKQRAKSKL